jgi:hypothetical protein
VTTQIKEHTRRKTEPPPPPSQEIEPHSTLKNNPHVNQIENRTRVSQKSENRTRGKTTTTRWITTSAPPPAAPQHHHHRFPDSITKRNSKTSRKVETRRNRRIKTDADLEPWCGGKTSSSLHHHSHRVYILKKGLD